MGIPNFDVDIVVEGDGLNFASKFAKKINAILITHPRFQTATLITPNEIKIDIATARSEVYPHPASLPVVQSGTIIQDLARRDFTVNALAINLLPENFGHLVDFYSGKKDIARKVIRILHDLSFIDDPTRIIRAVRFEQRLNFRIQSHTLKLIKQAKKLGMLNKVSPHRLRDEIILMLKEPIALKCIQRLNKLVGFNFIHPEIRINKTRLAFLNAINKQVHWFNNEFSDGRALDVWLMYFTGILSNFKKSKVNKICRILGLRKDEERRIITFKDLPEAKISKLSRKDILPNQIYQILAPLSFEVILLLRAQYNNKLLHRHIEDFFKYYNSIKPYLSGEDLKQAGLNPSPYYKKVFRQLLDLQLNGKIKSKQEAVSWVKKKSSKR